MKIEILRVLQQRTEGGRGGVYRKKKQCRSLNPPPPRSSTAPHATIDASGRIKPSFGLCVLPSHRTSPSRAPHEVATTDRRLR